MKFYWQLFGGFAPQKAGVIIVILRELYLSAVNTKLPAEISKYLNFHRTQFTTGNPFAVGSCFALLRFCVEMKIPRNFIPRRERKVQFHCEAFEVGRGEVELKS